MKADRRVEWRKPLLIVIVATLLGLFVSMLGARFLGLTTSDPGFHWANTLWTRFPVAGMRQGCFSDAETSLLSENSDTDAERAAIPDRYIEVDIGKSSPAMETAILDDLRRSLRLGQDEGELYKGVVWSYSYGKYGQVTLLRKRKLTVVLGYKASRFSQTIRKSTGICLP